MDSPPPPQEDLTTRLAEALQASNVNVDALLLHLGGAGAKPKVKPEPPSQGLTQEQAAALKGESDHLLAHTDRPTFKKDVIRPNLKDLTRKVEDVDWTRSLNSAVMNCTFADILIDVVQVIEK